MNHLILFEAFKKQREFIFLIGPPGSGKSYYINTLKSKSKDYVVINRDTIATEIAEREGLIYRDMYRAPFNFPPELFYIDDDGNEWVKGYEKFGYLIDVPKDNFLSAFYKRHFKKLYELNNEVEHTFNYRLDRYILDPDVSIILDLTNQTKKIRKPILDKIKNENYKIIAVIFNQGGTADGMRDLLVDVNKKRDIELEPLGRHKKVPITTIENYIRLYEPPTKFEGFDEIVHIDNKADLQKYIES